MGSDPQSHLLSQDLAEHKKCRECIAELEAELKTSEAGGWCDVCTGSGDPKTGVPCICRGTGKAQSAMSELRVLLCEAEANLKREQNGRKETLHTLDGLTEKLAETRAALKVATSGYNESLNANRPLPIDRELLGQKVREVWIRFAQKHPNPKAHWLTPWEHLDEDMREVDRLIGEDIARWALVADAASRSMGLDDPTIRREVERQAKMERVVKVAKSAHAVANSRTAARSWLDALTEALADLEKLHAK